MRLWHLVGKELLLLRRDWHALALLFIMPTLFILIMSLALRDEFDAHSGSVRLEYALVDQAGSADSRDLTNKLADDPAFRQLSAAAGANTLRAQVAADELRFLVIVEPHFLDRALAGKVGVRLWVSPSTSPALARLFTARLQTALGELLLARFASASGATALDAGLIRASVESHFARAGGVRETPSAVQQNVPAWLLFAMFFIAVPLSTTVIRERSNGTLARLATLGVSRPMLLVGKLLPYMVINFLQALLMAAVGMWLVPLLGGDALQLGSAWGGLAMMTVVASFAAVSYALLIAELTTTTEQATLLSGVCNIVLAALGGVMVPRFVMPEVMRQIGMISPMTWGLEGFLDLLLRGGGLAQAWPHMMALGGFGLLMWVAAATLANRRQLWR